MGGISTGLGGVIISVLNVLMIATGILLRRARGWRLGLNVAAIALFIELTLLPSAFGVLFAFMDAIVLYALIRHRAWFLWTPERALAQEAEDAAEDAAAADQATAGTAGGVMKADDAG
jgi:hypothetical protein